MTWGTVAKWTAGILGSSRQDVRQMGAAGRNLVYLVCHIASTKWVSLKGVGFSSYVLTLRD